MANKSVTTRVKFSSNMQKFIKEQEFDLNTAVLQMATDIHRQAVVLAPKDTRALANSGRITKESSGKVVVTFGGGAVRYARRRHFENKKNPHTLKYLERAGRNVVKNPGKYIKTI